MPGEVVMTDLATAARQEITEALAHLAHDAGRLALADPAHARKHASIDRLLSALELIPEDA